MKKKIMKTLLLMIVVTTIGWTPMELSGTVEETITIRSHLKNSVMALSL
jgi:hypothetical protein